MGDLTLRSLQGKSLAEKLEIAGQWAGADGRVMDGIWRTESSRGQNMVSSAGARGHFGLMPNTMATWSERLGFSVDPDNFDQALIAGAATLRENLQRFGNLPDALRAYNGGWNRSNWNNPETAAYVGKVLGGEADVPSGSRRRAAAGPVARPQTTMADIAGIDPDALLSGQVAPAGPQFPGARPASGLDPDAVLAGRPADYGNYRPPTRTQTRQSEAQRFLGMIGGLTPFADPSATTLQGARETNRDHALSVQREIEKEQNGPSPTLRFSAAIVQNTITGNLMQAIDENLENGPRRVDPNFVYEDRMDEIEEGRNRRQIVELRERASSYEDAIRIRERQDERQEIQELAGDNIAVNLTAGLIDPVGYLLGGVVGKGFQAVGGGARVAFAAGNRAAGTGLMVGEGVAGNIAGTAIIDRLAGEYQAPEDYAINALFGGLLGVAATPFVSKGVAPGNNPELAMANNLRRAVEAEEAVVLAEAIERAGPAASNEAISTMATTVRTERVRGTIEDSFSPVPEENRLFNAEDADTIDMAARQTDLTAMGGDALSDDAQRALVGQLLENSRRIVKNNPIGGNVALAPAGSPGVVAAMGLSSTGETLLRSSDPVAQAIGLTLTEGTTGRGGRRHSAALTAAMSERRFMRPVLGYEDAFHLYRQSRRVGWMQWAFGDGSVRREFDIAVAEELRGRARPDLYTGSEHASVRKAADYYSAGMKMMGEEQVRVGTLGSQNIRPGDPSYFPQHVSSAKVQALNNNQKAAFRGIIAEQSRQIFGWDKKFSDYFGKRYLESAIDRAAGNYDVPVNLTHHSSSGFVQDLLESMRAGASKTDIVRLDKANQAFARGGPGFTRGRLNFDVMSTYTLDDGSTVKLLDIMDTDMMGMYRSYARRSAGEVALQQYGIAGAHGLKTVRAYLKVAHDAKRINNDVLSAFDQISAEFLNTPFGAHQGAFMDNVRVMTSVIKLGGMGITQFGEYGNGIAVLGVGRVFKAIKDIPRLVGEVRAARRGEAATSLLSSIEKQQGFEVGLDSWIMTRALDVKDNEVQMYGREGIGLGSRLVRGASHTQAILSGHRMITAVQVRGMSEQVLHKAMRYIHGGLESKALDDMGFSPELRAAIKGSMGKMSKFHKNGELASFDLFAGDLTPAQRSEFVGVINRASNQIIQGTYIGETGKWAHDGFLKLLFQFRTFSLTAVEKQWGRNLRNYGALKSMMFLMGAMSFAAPLQIARVQSRMLSMDEKERKEYADRYLTIPAIAQATMSYASAAGFAGDIWDIGGSMASNIMGDAAPDFMQGTINPRGGGRSQGKLLGGVVAPSAGLAEDLFGLANGNWKNLKTLLPGANLPYMVPIINAIEETADED